MSKTVVIGMSGGVDSSVSALLLKQQGFNVIGLFVKSWEETDDQGVCTSTQDFNDVARVCEIIGIPYYSINCVEEYRENVFSHFVEELRAGHTPNPDILCNREIKFKVLFNKALAMGADLFATGHYCQTSPSGNLLKGFDPGKDQSYFLYTVTQTILQQVLFPIGHLLKSDVRALAKAHRLPTAEKKDSTGVCFIGERDFKQFVSQYIPFTPGPFQTLSGKEVGTHSGVAFYTIGQRRGLAIGGEGEAWFVVAKDVKNNIVFVEQGADHPALYCDHLAATELSWVSTQPTSLPFSCQAKIRYRQADQDCVITRIEDGTAYVHFPIPQRAITPRQSIVFYDGNTCLGGGIITPRKNHRATEISEKVEMVREKQDKTR